MKHLSVRNMSCAAAASGMQVGIKLCKSRRKEDMMLGKAICNELVADWREAEAERLHREELAAAKLQQRLALEEAGRSRRLRERKKVSHTSCFMVYPAYVVHPFGLSSIAVATCAIESNLQWLHALNGLLHCFSAVDLTRNVSSPAACTHKCPAVPCSDIAWSS
jgi:hypothetical protein